MAWQSQVKTQFFINFISGTSLTKNELFRAIVTSCGNKQTGNLSFIWSYLFILQLSEAQTTSDSFHLVTSYL